MHARSSTPRRPTSGRPRWSRCRPGLVLRRRPAEAYEFLRRPSWPTRRAPRPPRWPTTPATLPEEGVALDPVRRRGPAAGAGRGHRGRACPATSVRERFRVVHRHRRRLWRGESRGGARPTCSSTGRTSTPPWALDPRPASQPRRAAALGPAAASSPSGRSDQPVTGLFFLNATHRACPMPFVQALLAIGYRPVPLSRRRPEGRRHRHPADRWRRSRPARGRRAAGQPRR